MARDKVKSRNGPWLKRVLIPFWVVQVVLMLAIAVMFILLMVADPTSFRIMEVLFVILSLICIILNVTEMILFARRKLKPLTYLIFQLVKTPIWFGLFVDMLVRGMMLQRGQDSSVNTATTIYVIIFAALFFVFLGSLIYGSVIFHRHRMNKRKGPKGNNITQNPYYNGPYSETGVATANYRPLNSPYPFHGQADATMDGDESVMTAMPAAEHYTPDLQDKKRRISSVGSGPTELAGQEGHSLIGSDTKGLPAVPEVYELASAKSIRRSNNVGVGA